MVPLQVLVADDEPVSRTVVGAMLKKAGYPVIFAPDGQQAWQQLDSDDPPSLAVLDWEMPGLQGPEVVERIRSRENQTPTYVILLTSRDSSTDIVRGLRAGADDYVTKPANEDELIARVGAVLRRVRPALAGETLAYADLEMDVAAHKVRREGRPVWASSASAPSITRRPRFAPIQRSGSISHLGERWPTQGRAVSAVR